MTLSNQHRAGSSSLAPLSAVRSSSSNSHHHALNPPAPVIDLLYNSPNSLATNASPDATHSHYLGTSIISAPTLPSHTSFYAPPTFGLYPRPLPNDYLTGAGLFHHAPSKPSLTTTSTGKPQRNAVLPASAPLMPLVHPSNVATPGNSNVTGKRFLRRAKRWAVLQQKKQLLAAAAAAASAHQKEADASERSKMDGERSMIGHHDTTASSNNNKTIIDSVTGSPLISLHHQHQQQHQMHSQRRRGVLPPPIQTNLSLIQRPSAMNLKSAPCKLSCLLNDWDSSDQERRDSFGCGCDSNGNICQADDHAENDYDCELQQQQLAAANVFSAFHQQSTANTPVTSASNFFIDDINGQYNYTSNSLGLIPSPGLVYNLASTTAPLLNISVANNDLLNGWSSGRNVLSSTSGVIDMLKPTPLVKSQRNISDVSCSDESMTSSSGPSRSSPIDLAHDTTNSSASNNSSNRASPATLPDIPDSPNGSLSRALNEISVHDSQMPSMLGQPIITTNLPSPFYLHQRNLMPSPHVFHPPG